MIMNIKDITMKTMYRNLIYALLAAFTLAATSCVYEDVDASSPAEETQVTFSLGLEKAIATRAISDGTQADRLVYAIYKIDAAGAPVLQEITGSLDGQVVVEDFASGMNVIASLAKGQTYRIAFWAQDSDCTAYDTQDLTNVKVDYNDAANNDESRDAFWATLQFVAVADATYDVTLRRPFAQVNVGVIEEDWTAAVASLFEVGESAAVIRNAATSMNLLTGEVGDETTDVEVSYAAAAIPDEPLFVNTDETTEEPEEYVWLSTSYILVADRGGVADENGILGGAGATLESAEFTFVPKGEGTAIVLKDGLTNVPVQRNWRTNVLGRVLTGDVNFTITVDPNYDNDVLVKENSVDVSSVEDLMKWAYAVNNGNNALGLNLLADIVVPAYAIEEDKDNNTYSFTTTAITVENGVPSGSNWIPVCSDISELNDGYCGVVKGGNHTISGLCVRGGQYTGFIGLMYNGASVKGLVIDNASVSGGESTGAVAGRAQHNTVIENVKVTNSNISGTAKVGGIVGYNYSRNVNSSGTVYGEELPFVRNCSVDANSSVVGSSTDVGGICGNNTGAVIMNCVNSADVTGKNNVGGVVGYSREYNTGRDAYVIACGSTADAAVKATDKYAGGIVGQVLKDNNHEGVVSYIVASYSNSAVTAKYASTMVGASVNGSIIGSYSVKNGTEKYSGGSGSFNRIASEHFTDANEVTEEFVAEMNAAIDAYNNTVGIEVTCPYRWSWSSGNWPVLF